MSTKAGRKLLVMEYEEYSNKNNDERRRYYLSLYWSSRAIAIYFPDKINWETSLALIDLCCERK